MRILVVHPSLPPNEGAEPICTEKVIRALHLIGVKVVVVTGTRATPIEGIEYHAVPGYDQDSLEPLIEKLQRWRHRYPEGSWNWARRAANKISYLVNSANIDVVYSRSMPFISHIATYFASLPAKVLWVAHFSDPWPAEGFFGSERKDWRLVWHRRIIEKSDAVSFPCERIARFCKESQWGLNRPRLLPPLIVPHQLPDVTPKLGDKGPHHGKCVFMHCGTFYGKRQPDELVLAWARWLARRPELRARVQLEHVGPFSERFQRCVMEAGVADTAVQGGTVSYQQSLQRMTEATVLLLIESTELRVSIYLPSKFIDYLWARKPIIALTSEEGTIADALGKRYSLRADPWNTKAIEDTFDRALRVIQDPECHDARTLDIQRERYASRKVAQDLLTQLDLLRSRA